MRPGGKLTPIRSPKSRKALCRRRIGAAAMLPDLPYLFAEQAGCNRAGHSEGEPPAGSEGRPTLLRSGWPIPAPRRHRRRTIGPGSRRPMRPRPPLAETLEFVFGALVIHTQDRLTANLSGLGPTRVNLEVTRRSSAGRVPTAESSVWPVAERPPRPLNSSRTPFRPYRAGRRPQERGERRGPMRRAPGPAIRGYNSASDCPGRRPKTGTGTTMRAPRGRPRTRAIAAPGSARRARREPSADLAPSRSPVGDSLRPRLEAA